MPDQPAAILSGRRWAGPGLAMRRRDTRRPARAIVGGAPGHRAGTISVWPKRPRPVILPTSGGSLAFRAGTGCAPTFPARCPGISAERAGVATAAVLLGGPLLRPAIGPLPDRLGRHARLVVSGLGGVAMPLPRRRVGGRSALAVFAMHDARLLGSLAREGAGGRP